MNIQIFFRFLWYGFALSFLFKASGCKLCVIHLRLKIPSSTKLKSCGISEDSYVEKLQNLVIETSTEITDTVLIYQFYLSEER